jgi:hypothetical protein
LSVYRRASVKFPPLLRGGTGPAISENVGRHSPAVLEVVRPFHVFADGLAKT